MLDSWSRMSGGAYILGETVSRADYVLTATPISLRTEVRNLAREQMGEAAERLGVVPEDYVELSNLKRALAWYVVRIYRKQLIRVERWLNVDLIPT